MTARARTSGPRRDFALDPARLLLELERVERELEDPVAAVERVLPPDLDGRAVELDDVVTGARVAAEPQAGDRARVDDEEILQPPRVRHVLVSREDEVGAGALQALERVAGVMDDVPL